MYKYRVLKLTTGLGRTYYQPQFAKRFIFWDLWFNLSSDYYNTEDEARRCIKSDQPWKKEIL
jgi:hypothetical protein